MSYKNDSIERLQQRLLMIPHAKAVSTNIELAAVRCPLCGDSTNANSAHMYIGIKEIDGKDYVCYDCKKCSSSGMVTPNLLRRLGIVDVEVEEYLKSLRNKSYIRTFTQEDDISSIQYKYPKPTKEDKFKIEYLNSRIFGVDFNDYNNILKYRVVINFSKFLAMNKIVEPQVSKLLIPKLDYQAVGFVSADKCSVSFRNIKPNEVDLDRFNIVHLYQNVRHPYSYMPPVAVDLLTPMPRIVISESSFNIINIKNYFYGDDDVDTIYASASRKGCNRLIKQMIEKTGFVGGELVIYADNEKSFSVGYFENILEEFMETFNIKLVLNTDGKDFGEPPKDGVYHYKTIRI